MLSKFESFTPWFVPWSNPCPQRLMGPICFSEKSRIRHGRFCNSYRRWENRSDLAWYRCRGLCMWIQLRNWVLGRWDIGRIGSNARRMRLRISLNRSNRPRRNRRRRGSWRSEFTLLLGGLWMWCSISTTRRCWMLSLTHGWPQLSRLHVGLSWC